MKIKHLLLALLACSFYVVFAAENITIELKKTTAYQNVPTEFDIKPVSLGTVELSDRLASKYMKKGFAKTDVKDKLAYFEKAALTLETKNEASFEDIQSLCALYMMIADIYFENNEKALALLSCLKSYNNLKEHNMSENTSIALYNLTKILDISKAMNNKNQLENAINLIETTQMELAQQYPMIYIILAEYYKDKNIKKSKYYHKKSIARNAGFKIDNELIKK